MSITAIVENGVIKPLEPLPEDWSEGQTVTISENDDHDDEEPFTEEWLEEYERLASEISEEDYEKAAAAVAEHRREAKEMMAREMGLK